MQNNIWDKRMVERGFEKKYFIGTRLRCLDQCTWKGKGSKVQGHCRVVKNLIQECLYWIPKRGKLIGMQKDRITRQEPLLQNSRLEGIQIYLEGRGYNTLIELSHFKSNHQQEGWKHIYAPKSLHQFKTLLSLLHGSTPANIFSKYCRGQGKDRVFYV